MNLKDQSRKRFLYTLYTGNTLQILPLASSLYKHAIRIHVTGKFLSLINSAVQADIFQDDLYSSPYFICLIIFQNASFPNLYASFYGTILVYNIFSFILKLVNTNCIYKIPYHKQIMTVYMLKYYNTMILLHVYL